jgi:hypothetical protein
MSGQPGAVVLGVAQVKGRCWARQGRTRLAGTGFAQHEQSIADAVRAQS